MMNGSSTLEGYMPNHRRHHRHAPARRRRRHQGQVALRVVLPLRRQPHRRAGAGAQSAQADPFRRRLVLGQRRAGGGGRGRSRHRRRSGRLDPHAGAFCGIYGMKPTHGLVPYTGVMPIESTIDHTGPMTGNVADNALMLEVIAGADGLDPRQYAPKVGDYVGALKRRRQGPENRRRQGGLRPRQQRGGRRRERARGGQALRLAGRDASRTSRFPST